MATRRRYPRPRPISEEAYCFQSLNVHLRGVTWLLRDAITDASILEHCYGGKYRDMEAPLQEAMRLIVGVRDRTWIGTRTAKDG